MISRAWLGVVFLGWPLGAYSASAPETSILTQYHSPHRVRIRLNPSVDRLNVRGLNLRLLEVRKGKKKRLVKGTVDGKIQIACDRKGVLVTSKDFKKRTRKPVSIESPAGFLRTATHLYREELRLLPGKKGCQLVNVLDLEKYLDGLVNAEFSSKWSPEAVAAQVVAARTYALYQMKAARKRGKAYDLESTVEDQLYAGTEKEDYRASRSVKNTRGMVLIHKRGPLKAFYHSTCGGRTQLPQRVWGRRYPGFKKRVRCSFCKSSPRYQWKLSFPGEKLARTLYQAVRRRGPPASWPRNWSEILRMGRIETVRPEGRDATGRNREVHTFWSVPGKSEWMRLSMKATQFRGFLDVAKFRSTAFSVAASRDFQGGRKFLFMGRGNGHGVGMCQWGAKVMGEKGHKMAKILGFYYPDAQLKKLW